MRNVIYRGFLILLFVLVSVQLLYSIQIYGATPDILLILVVYISQKKGVMEGQLTGFFSGLAEDIFSVQLFGIHAFSKLLIGFISGHIYHSFLVDNVAVQALIGFIAALIHSFFFILAKAVFSHIDLAHYLFPTLLVKVLYTAILTPVIFAFLNFMERRLGEP